ncbi:hypothetical protein Fmac_010132 [Flemingia macrophylla]|uniref:Uncharacterized protein n=1 Tax=Flemingia macrophylla TaxID=520843 RepID=A0ABD1N264_9FABA
MNAFFHDSLYTFVNTWFADLTSFHLISMLFSQLRLFKVIINAGLQTMNVGHHPCLVW